MVATRRALVTTRRDARVWHPGVVDRVTHGARGNAGNRPDEPLPQRSAQGQPIPSDAPGSAGHPARVARASARRAGAPRPSDDRYRRGGRRTEAQPLQATWQPDVTPPPPPPEDDPEDGDGKPAKPSKASKLVDRYGWRVYAVPVLMVLTVLVVVDNGKGSGAQDQDPANPGSAESDQAAVATENPAPPAEVNIPTAELPEGGEYTQAGAGTWHTVPGEGPQVGSASEVYTYTIEVEDGLDPGSYTGDEAFATAVEGTLSDPRSWTGNGEVSLQRVGEDQEPDFRVSLTSPETLKRTDLCGFGIPYEASCYRRDSDNRVVINLARWARGAKAFEYELTAYRQYAINHEVGHALRNNHVGCAEEGALAPVMMQQSFGVANDYVAQLNENETSNKDAVPADGKVCKPNAWPNPAAQGG